MRNQVDSVSEEIYDEYAEYSDQYESSLEDVWTFLIRRNLFDW